MEITKKNSTVKEYTNKYEEKTKIKVRVSSVKEKFYKIFDVP